jgi:hypothetical protein
LKGGGWNTVWAKTKRGAIKAALKEYKDSDTLNRAYRLSSRKLPKKVFEVQCLFFTKINNKMNKLQALKCIEVTSQTQADNGNICYHDPIANCDYILYENGYVRRSLPRVRNYYGRLDTTHAIYQLNPTRTEKHVSEWSGNIFDNKIRIMLPTHEERMECAARWSC